MLMLWTRDGDGMLVDVSLWLVGSECETHTEEMIGLVQLRLWQENFGDDDVVGMGWW